MLNPAVREALVNLDVDRMIALDAAVNPHLPSPGDKWKVLLTMHVARTATRSIPKHDRIYSHHFLRDRGMLDLSQLPDRLRQKADQVGAPRIVTAVGVASSARDPFVKKSIEGAMLTAAMDRFELVGVDDAIVREHIREARRKERKALGLSAIASVDPFP